MSEMKDILAERGANYGDYTEQSRVSQDLKKILFTRLMATGATFEPWMLESLEMIAHKLARVVNGNPFHEDSWRDIGGYAILAADRVKAVNAEDHLEQILNSGVMSTGDLRDNIGGGPVFTPSDDDQSAQEKTGESSGAYPFPVGEDDA